MALILSAALVSCGEPEEYDVDVSEVANIAYSADDDAVTALSDSNVDIDEKGIYTVHGIIIRSEACEKDGRYILAESEEKPDGICFSYEDGVDEEIATGSEIVVKGTFKDVDEVKVLSVESMEVKNQVFPVHKFSSVSKLIASANDYVNKTVSVKGLVNINEDTGSYVISNSKKTKTVVLEKLSEKKKKSLEYGIYQVTGKFYFNDGEATIEVETMKLIEKKEKEVKEKSTAESNQPIHFDSLGALFSDPKPYVGKRVSVIGYIDGIDGDGNTVTLDGSIFNDVTFYMMEDGMMLQLKGISVGEGEELCGGYTQITGIFGGGVGDPYFIDVEKIGD